MRRIGCSQHTDTLKLDLGSATEVHIGRRMKANTRMAVLAVVPAEETLAEGAAVLDRAEASRELWSILECFEVRLGEGIVVRSVRAGMAFGNAQVSQQQRHGLGGHGGAAIGMNCELVDLDVLLADSFAEQSLGQFSRLARGQ